MDVFLRALAEELLTPLGAGRGIVAIDGVDGSGKTVFAANLAAHIEDRPVVIIHADDFLNPSPVRHAQGRTSPIGFWEDTYNYSAPIEHVLAPLSGIEDGWYSPASFDPATDQTVHAEKIRAPSEALIVLEGMFLHRDELASFWDASEFLDVPFTETARRMAVRNGSSPDPSHPAMRRYVGGQRLYFDAVRPWERATFVVDNSDFAFPKMIRPDMVSAVR